MGESKGINISNSLVVVFCCSRNLHAKNYFVEKGVGLERRATIGRHVLRGDDLYPFSPLFVWNIPFSFRALKKKNARQKRERETDYSRWCASAVPHKRTGAKDAGTREAQNMFTFLLTTWDVSNVNHTLVADDGGCSPQSVPIRLFFCSFVQQQLWQHAFRHRIASRFLIVQQQCTATVCVSSFQSTASSETTKRNPRIVYCLSG